MKRDMATLVDRLDKEGRVERPGPVGKGRRLTIPKRPWSGAKPTVCRQGHRHASKMEARVCDRLALETQAKGQRLFQQVRLPLWTLGRGPGDRPMTISVDFAIVESCRLVRLVDAKAKGRISRDWRRGASAVEACYGIRIEEVSS